MDEREREEAQDVRAEWRLDRREAARATAEPTPGQEALLAAIAVETAELAVAIVGRGVGLLRRDPHATSVPRLLAAHRAIEFGRSMLGQAVEQVAALVERRARCWPKECACGAVHDRAAWAALVLVGRMDDVLDRDGFVSIDGPAPEVDELELRQCRCGSTLAMPVET